MLTIDLIGPTWPIQISSKCKVTEDQSHQDSRQINQAQESCSKIYEK